MQLVGADANFRAKAKFGAISESRRCVPVNCSGIDLVKKFLSTRDVASDDNVAMMRATFFDVRNRVFDVVHGASSEDKIEIFRGPVVVAGGTEWLIAKS